MPIVLDGRVVRRQHGRAGVLRSGMPEARHAGAIEAWYGLNSDPVLTGPVPRGQLGRVWRLMTSRSAWAVRAAADRTSQPVASICARLADIRDTTLGETAR